MSFWQKFKEGFRRFMAGRYGADALSQGIIIAGLVLFLLAVFTRIGLFSLLAMALDMSGHLPASYYPHMAQSARTKMRATWLPRASCAPA